MVYPTLLPRTHIPFTKVYWKNTICPTLLLTGKYAVNMKVYWKNMVCFTVADWYSTHESLLKEYGLPPHCCCIHTSRTQSLPIKTECSTRVDVWWCVLQCLKHKIDCRGEKSVIDWERPKKHQKKERSGVITSMQCTQTVYNSHVSFYCDKILKFSSSVVFFSFSLVTFIVFYVTHISSLDLYKCIQNSLKSCQST